MKILIASQTYSYGNGQASFTIRLAENLVQAGHQVMVVTPSERMRSYSQIINGVRVEKVPAIHVSILHPAMYITPFPRPRIKQIFKEFKPEVVHIQDHYFLCGSAVNEARRLRIPLIGTNHFLPENILPFLKNFPLLQRLLSIPLWSMMLAVFNKLDLATTPSETAARILRNEKIRIPVRAISNGVDTTRFIPDPRIDRAAIRVKYGLAPDKPTFLYVGRLDGEKRIDILLDAVALLKRADIQVAIGGFGLYGHALQKQAEHLGLLDGRVKFIGFVPPEDLPVLYQSADVFCMPSPEELQSIATLEALACGKPVLAANARALPELVKQNVNGYLFKPGSAKDAANYMTQFLNECEKWPAMGQASLALSQAHSLENTIKHYEEYYGMVMEKIQITHKQTTRNRSALHRPI